MTKANLQKTITPLQVQIPASPKWGKRGVGVVIVELVATRKVFLHACVLACRRLKLGNELYLIYFS